MLQDEIASKTSENASDRSGRAEVQQLSSPTDTARQGIGMAQGRGTRRALLKPHTLFCGCCCSLQLGSIIGCSLFLLLFGMNIGSAFSERHPDPVLARSFCEVRAALPELSYHPYCHSLATC